ncbi:hypothetical protein, partial [Streptomyces sp. SID161]|uniref:hypothetical protein n=1 Tax=Streptomyces sp. SID161 TaxID=2690251 RepID=UPI001F241B80
MRCVLGELRPLDLEHSGLGRFRGLGAVTGGRGGYGVRGRGDSSGLRLFSVQDLRLGRGLGLRHLRRGGAGLLGLRDGGLGGRYGVADVGLSGRDGVIDGGLSG